MNKRYDFYHDKMNKKMKIFLSSSEWKTLCLAVTKHLNLGKDLLTTKEVKRFLRIAALVVISTARLLYVYGASDRHDLYRVRGEAIPLEGSSTVIGYSLFAPDINGRLYVKKGSSGTGDSWDNAIGELADALQVAKTLNADNAGTVTQIWVARGTYHPKYTISGDIAPERERTFQMQNGVAIYGGFADDLTGTSGSIADRTDIYDVNATTLSGDLGTPGDNSDNAYHLIYNTSNATTGLLLDNTAILDGFIVSGGHADGSGDHADGAGMFNRRSDPLLRNVVFENNTATGNGGAIHNRGSSPELIDVEIRENVAANGGGVYNMNFSSGGTTNSNPVLTNTVIRDNTASAGGGGIHNVTNSTPIITSSKISNNIGVNGGGIHNGNSSPVVSSSIISGNTALNGGGIYNISSSPIISASKISNNTAATHGGGIII